jgi:hypothetical protein
MEQKMTPASASFSLKVVATETLSNTASTATPASILLLQRDAELLVGLQQLRVDLVEALRLLLASAPSSRRSPGSRSAGSDLRPTRLGISSQLR